MKYHKKEEKFCKRVEWVKDYDIIPAVYMITHSFTDVDAIFSSWKRRNFA